MRGLTQQEKGHGHQLMARRRHVVLQPCSTQMSISLFRFVVVTQRILGFSMLTHLPHGVRPVLKAVRADLDRVDGVDLLAGKAADAHPGLEVRRHRDEIRQTPVIVLGASVGRREAAVKPPSGDATRSAAEI